VFFVALLVVTVTALAFGQAQTGTVSGTVVDETGAVIPGAQVTLTNVETGVTREMATNEQGYFYFDRVSPGLEYRVTITAQGFKKREMTGLDVRVAKNTDVGSQKLEIGAVADTVTVEAGTAPILETQSAQITSSLSNKQVVSLKSGFGGLDTAALLTPGVIPGMGNINSNGMQVAANGQRSRSTQFMLDGHQMNDITIGGPSVFFNNLDNVAEYQVITNQFSAEYGRNLGATVNIITKGGTNDYHGALRWEYRGAGLNSKTSLQSRNNLTKPVLVDNRWSANIQGPVLKDRLFFTFGYTGREQPGGSTSTGVGSTLVLTQNGIATLMAAYPTSVPLQVYANNGPFAISSGNPTCVGTLQSLTLGGSSTGPGGTTVTGPTVAGVQACDITRQIPSNTSEREYSTRIDFVTQKHTLTGRFLRRNNQFCCSGGRDGYWIDIPDKQKTVGITHIYTITPNLINNFKFSYAEFGVQFETTSAGNTSPISQIRSNLSNFSMPSGFQSFGLATNLPQNRFLDTFQYANTLSYSKGKHFMKFGVEFQRNLTTLFFLPFINGQFVFNSPTLNDFLNNTPNQVSFTEGSGSFDPREFDQFYFAQDDWRMTPHFTVNIGFRYEHNGQPINQAVDEILKRESNPSTAFWLQTVPLDQRTMPRQPNDNNNVAPRIGFAWTPQWNNFITGNGQMTIRGGYGIAYELAFYNILLNMTTAAPRVFAFSLTCPAAPSTACNTIPVSGTGIGSDVAGSIPVPVNTIDPRTFFQTVLSSDFHNPYGQNWSLGIQREIGRTQVFEVRYVGTNGVSLFQSRNANPLFSRLAAPSTVVSQPFGGTTGTPFGGLGTVTMPGFPQFIPTGFTPCPAPPVTVPVTPNPTGLGRADCTRAATRMRANTGFSNYHSLQARYDMRNFKGQLNMGASFTYSRGIDNVSEIFGFFGDGSVAFSENPFNFTSAERGVSNQSISPTMTMYYIWDLPWYKSQNGVLGKVLGGWSLSGITTLLAGRPFTPIQRTGNRYCGQDSGFNNSFVGLPATCRPFVGNPSAPLTITTAAGAVVPNVGYVDGSGVVHRIEQTNLSYIPRLTDPVVTMNDVRFIFNDDNAIRFLGFTPFGIGRNNFEGDGTVNFDIAIDKRVNITERIAIKYRMSMVNAFNHRNFLVPQNRIDLANFAIPERNDVGPSNNATPGGRSIRMILWLQF